MRASRIVALIASLAACGGGPPSTQPSAPAPSPPTTAPVAGAVAGPTSAALPAGATVEPAPDKADVARTAALASMLGRLPPTIESTELTAVEARALPFLLMRNDPFVTPTALPCTAGLAAKTSHVLELGYPFPGDKHPLDGATVVALVTTAATKEVVACLAEIAGVKPRPTKAKDKRDTLIGRTLLRDLGDGLLVLVGNKVSADPEATARALFGIAGTAPHPLARILDHGAATPMFSAYALDYTWELLGVPSTGMILEYADRRAGGPIAIRLRFADTQTATLALARFDHPDDAVFRSAFGESAEEVMRTLRTRAKITLRDDEVILRGTATTRELEYNEMPFNMFLALGIPLTRPLTREEERRLFRPLPGTPEAATFRARPWVPARR